MRATLCGVCAAALLAAGCDSASTRAPIVADCAASPTTALPTAVAAARTQGPGATVQIEGTCRLSRPMALSHADSGTRWVGSAGAAISGGIALADAGWKKHGNASCAGCGSVWTYALPSGIGPSRQLYLGGVRANRTVMPFPQDGARKSAAGVHSPLAGAMTSPRWQAGGGIELIHRGTHTCNYSSSIQWAETRVPVQGTGASCGHWHEPKCDAGLFTMVEPAYQHSNNNRCRALPPVKTDHVYDAIYFNGHQKGPAAGTRCSCFGGK